MSELITNINKKGKQFNLNAEVTELSDHLLRFSVVWEEFGFMGVNAGGKVERLMDNGRVWHLDIIEVRNNEMGDFPTAVYEFLCETQNLKKVQRRKVSA
jgi:hypothetical protein